MPDFVSLPIKDGVGPVHLNRFRISMVPNPYFPGAAARIGRDLFNGMAQYMSKRTASVEVDSHTWNGEKTLQFRGVAVFRPFIDLPGQLVLPPPLPTLTRIHVPLAPWLRDVMIPDVHTDSVGPAFKGPTSFTAQTLKRQYETSDDATIRTAIKATVIPAIMAEIAAEGIIGAATAPVQLLVANALADKLGDIAVFINQHHFLAGRRSFRFDEGSAFGYTDGRLVFETAAIERYSLTAYKLATDIAMGGAPAVIRPVWIEMVTRVAYTNVMRVIVESPQPGWRKDQEVHYIQQELPDISKVTSSAQWPEMNRLHPKLFDPQSEAA